MRLGPREKNGSFRKAYANEYAPELPLPVLCLCSQPQLPPASAGNPPTLTDRSGPISYVVQLLSHVQLLVTPWTAACQASLSFTISWSLLKLMSIESVIPSNHPIPSPPALSLSQHQGIFLMRSLLFSLGPSVPETLCAPSKSNPGEFL